jgi:hemolysin III
MVSNVSINSPEYTIGDEIANAIIHGFGTLLSIAGLVILIIRGALQGNAWHVVSFTVFGSTMILLYLASTLYHSIQNPRVKLFLRKLDHSAIYLLIAGTYTPFVLVSLRGGWGWSLFGVIWGLAILGIVTKFLFIQKIPRLTVVIYIFMGWLILIAGPQILRRLEPESLTFLIIGGIAYTLGTVFYAWRKLPFSHAIWHLFVLGGSICHFFAVLYIL